MTTPTRPEEKESKGFVINDPAAGTIYIGEDVKTERTRQVEIHSASGSHLKLFKDGGFELHGESCTTADNIDSRAKHGLNIQNANGIRIDAGNGELVFNARVIRFQSTASDEALIIRSSNNLEIEASDTIRLSAPNIALGAKNKLLLASKGAIYMRGTGGVTIIEPKAKLIPTNLGDFVDKLIDTLVFGGL